MGCNTAKTGTPESGYHFRWLSGRLYVRRASGLWVFGALSFYGAFEAVDVLDGVGYKLGVEALKSGCSGA